MSLITIDGSQGEGGGQILRTSMALAAIGGCALRIGRIRARRPKPGLQRQHLQAVRAAARVCNGHLEGDELGSSSIVFTPQAPTAGDYRFDIGSAGSTALVAQTVLPILWRAGGASTLEIHGGTHNPMAPTVDFLRESFLTALHGLGVSTTISLLRHGFNPAGGGIVQISVQPWQAAVPLELHERGKAIDRHAQVLLANLPAHVAEREALAIKHGLHWSHDEVDEEEVAADGPGNAVQIRLRHARCTTCFTAIGEPRLRAEAVAQLAVRAAQRHLATTAPVCPHLADQLLLPLAIGAGGSFRCSAVTEHTRSNAAIIAAFLGPVVEIDETADATGGHRVTVRGSQSP
jgi:RNA 3'-terminal phosphate cyclase (ATP)